jgi:tetraacyldisaccharide 4'-kinase
MKPQPWLAPLATLYGAAVHAKNVCYDRGIFRQDKLRGRVVSVGNLSTGGSGKTPFVLTLAELLTNAGIAVDILSRGYGREVNVTERVDPAPSSSAGRFGDEPLLLARATSLPVYVGRSRYAAGQLAELDAGPNRLHLLDDGFQHRQLYRDLDIVLLHRDDFHARMLPAGHLREPLSALRRAHVIVLRKEDQDLEEQLQPFAIHATVWHVAREVTLPSSRGPYFAFSGIARPQDFFAAVALQRNLVGQAAFPDHHRYNPLDMALLCRQAKSAGAACFVTTEKDFVRLTPGQLAALRQTAPVEIARLKVTIVEADDALSLISRL